MNEKERKAFGLGTSPRVREWMELSARGELGKKRCLREMLRPILLI